MEVEISAYKKELIEKIENFVKNREEIIFAYIFGSFTESETFNDVDLAIYIDENNNLSKKLFYEIELSNQLENITGISVDIILMNRASDFIIYRSSRGILVKNVDDIMRVSFITTHWKKYWDFKCKIREHITEIKSGNR